MVVVGAEKLLRREELDRVGKGIVTPLAMTLYRVVEPINDGVVTV